MRIIPASLTLAVSLCFTGQSFASPNQSKIERLDGSKISSIAIERTVAKLMKAARVTGLNVAIINDSKIAYVKSFGFRNKEQQ